MWMQNQFPPPCTHFGVDSAIIPQIRATMDFSLPKISAEEREALSRLKGHGHSGRGVLRLSALVEACCNQNLFPLDNEPSNAAGLLSVAVTIQELAAIDAALGYVAMNNYLCHRIVKCALDADFRRWFELCAQYPGAVWSVNLPAGAAGCRFVATEAERIYTIAIGPSETLAGRIEGACFSSAATTLTKRPLSGLEGLACYSLSWDSLRKAEPGIRSSCDESRSRQIVRMIEAERDVLLLAIGIAMLRAALDYVLEYTQQRRSFGKPICQHQAVMLRLADIGSALEAAEVGLAAAAQAHSEAFSVAAENMHLYFWNLIWDALSDAARLLGGHGFLEAHPAQGWLRSLASLFALHRLGGCPCSPFA
jgi:hypothetical protein